MQSLLERLNSGALHDAVRTSRPDCVDAKGNIHGTAKRAQFVDWMNDTKKQNGDDIRSWPQSLKTEYRKRYVPSH